MHSCVSLLLTSAAWRVAASAQPPVFTTAFQIVQQGLVPIHLRLSQREKPKHHLTPSPCLFRIEIVEDLIPALFFIKKYFNFFSSILVSTVLSVNNVLFP